MVPKKEDLHELGYITKLHGFRGELTAFLNTEILSDYEELDHLFLEVRGQMIPYIVELIETKTNKTVKLKLEGINTEEEAKALVKSGVYIAKEDISASDEDRLELRSLEEFAVIDEEKGPIGFVSQILELAGNPQLEIRFNGKTILLPLHPDFIKTIDREKREMHISAPPGLIDLYL
jgi:16S rRNA processing protein RimM